MQLVATTPHSTDLLTVTDEALFAGFLRRPFALHRLHLVPVVTSIPLTHYVVSGLNYPLL